MTAGVRVAVTGLHLGENCQPGPGVIRSLRHALGNGVRVLGLGYDALDSGLHARGLVDDAFLLPYPSSGPDAFVARLLEIHAVAPFDVLLPCLDVELPVLARAEARPRAAGIAFVAPTGTSLSRCSKEKLPELAQQCGIRTPRTIRVVDAISLAAAGRGLGFPMLVKGPFCEAEVVHGPGEAAAAFARLAARWGLPLLAQQFVAGEEFDVVALGDGDRMCAAVSMRKTMVTRLGKAWGGVTVVDDELTGAAAALIAALRWRGGCEVEMLRGHRDGELYLIEINPRFPAWVHLATVAGVNLPLGLLQLALGQPLPRFAAPQVGVWYVRHAVQLFGDQRDLEALLATARRLADPIDHAASPGVLS